MWALDINWKCNDFNITTECIQTIKALKLYPLFSALGALTPNVGSADRICQFFDSSLALCGGGVVYIEYL